MGGREPAGVNMKRNLQPVLWAGMLCEPIAMAKAVDLAPINCLCYVQKEHRACVVPAELPCMMARQVFDALYSVKLAAWHKSGS